jgi:hypothetical protein
MSALTERAIRTTTELAHLGMTNPKCAAQAKAYRQAMGDVIWHDVNPSSDRERSAASLCAAYALKQLLNAASQLDEAAYAL